MVEKIKNEIIRVKTNAEKMSALEPVTFTAMVKMCENFLSFIDSLEKE